MVCAGHAARRPCPADRHHRTRLADVAKPTPISRPRGRAQTRRGSDESGLQCSASRSMVLSEDIAGRDKTALCRSGSNQAKHRLGRRTLEAWGKQHGPFDTTLDTVTRSERNNQKVSRGYSRTSADIPDSDHAVLAACSQQPPRAIERQSLHRRIQVEQLQHWPLVYV